MIKFDVHAADVVHKDPFTSMRSMKYYLQQGGASIIQTAFAHSFFVHPEAVRKNPVYKKDRARYSREHYPGGKKRETAEWKGRTVRLDDNQYAQIAWEKYSGHKLSRGSGYGIRHIWGNPWNPDMFTAGWNICYMPFWAGMLTEKQHPHPQLEKAVQQAAWELYFKDDVVCERPRKIVKDPGVDLDALLEGQPVLILAPEDTAASKKFPLAKSNTLDIKAQDIRRIMEIRKKSNRSWSDIQKAARALQGKTAQFGTGKAAASAKSTVRKIQRETELDPAEIEKLLPL